jgi:hypothetical protein
LAAALAASTVLLPALLVATRWQQHVLLVLSARMRTAR